MAKVMLFIDGTWLYANTMRLGETFGSSDYHVDFGKLPRVLAGAVAKQLGSTDLDIVRTYLFGSFATNYDLRDEDAVQRRREFFEMLKEEHHYEVETFPINFGGRRLRKSDRDTSDTFEPKEKCVDISLATSMLYFAAIPYAYDIAIAVIGDQDFKPMLQHVRRLGKRVAIASIKGSCAPDYADPRDESRIKDFDIVWLDDLLGDLELKYDPHQLECQSHFHRGNRKVWTTFYPRKGRKFFCDACRQELTRQKQEAQRDLVSSTPSNAAQVAEEAASVGQSLFGTVNALKTDKGYGFIRSPDGNDYFFHVTDLAAGLEFDQLTQGTAVQFDLAKAAGQGKAGKAQNVRRNAAERVM